MVHGGPGSQGHSVLLSVPFTHHNAPGSQAGLLSKLHYMAPEVGRKMTGSGASTHAHSPMPPMQWHSQALTELKVVSMINRMCQLDWATLSDTWSNIMLEVAVKVFFED